MKGLFIAFFVVLFVSCSDDEPSVLKDYREENDLEIQGYLNENNLDATKTSSGLYYIIDEVGEGAEISATSDISVKYKGYFTDGRVLEENTDQGISTNLQQTIAGWTEGLQYFKEGGKGTLFIPAHLAFGSESINNVPGGSVLIFEVEIIDYVAENRQEILDYISDNELDAMESDSGLFYVIEEQGTGDNPGEASNVTVTYSGYFTDGEVFDSNDQGVSFNLNQVIAGWTEGMQYFKEGGKGKLLIPSALGYGRFGNQVIPGGAVLIFDVELLSIN